MKILIINSRYFLSAGPEKYMFGLIDVLKSKGHDIIIFSTKNSKNLKNDYENYFVDPIGGEDKVYYEEYKKDIKTSLEILERQFYSKYVKKKLDKLIKDTRPDIAYLLHHHNKLSPSVIDACKENNLPVIVRLSDFSLVCTRNNLLRGDAICEECISLSLFSGVKHKCVKNSYIGSFIKAAALWYYRKIKIYDKADRIIVPSLFTLDKVKFLFDSRKLVHIPSLVETKNKYNPYLGDYGLFVGRIEEEKGLIYAIKAFETLPFSLKIVGKSHSGYDKFLKDYVSKNNLKNIEFLDGKYGSELEELYEKSRFVILPTIWYENLPNVALEAMSHSKPIITTNLGSMKEIVKHDYNGLLFEIKNVEDLRRKIELLFHYKKMSKRLGKNAYLEATTKYSPNTHYQKLIEIFKEVKQWT